MSFCISTFIVHMRLRVRWRILAALVLHILCGLRRTKLFLHCDGLQLELIQIREHLVLNDMNPYLKTHFAIDLA